MLTNLYVFIIITIIPIVQITQCTYFDNTLQDQNDALRLLRLVGAERKVGSTSDVVIARKRASKTGDKNLHNIKVLLAKALQQICEMEASNHQDNSTKTKSDKGKNSPSAQSGALAANSSTSNAETKSKDEKKKLAAGCVRVTRWGHWTDWSSCSVSCGKGRQIRWRHCVKHCNEAETEMEEKTCQLPACGPSKLFGVIKLR